MALIQKQKNDGREVQFLEEKDKGHPEAYFDRHTAPPMERFGKGARNKRIRGKSKYVKDQKEVFLYHSPVFRYSDLRMSLTSQEMDRLAELARLEYSAKEKKAMQESLEPILGYVDRLQKIDTTGIPETETLPQKHLREDVALPIDDVAREIILSNFPDRLGDALQVPGVFENPKG